MPFRLSNMPVAFQRFINEVLGDLMDICTVGYLDDILIYSDSLEDHQNHICEVLHRLHTAGLYANLKKCKFHTDTVEYLRFILSPKGLQMDPTKVSMIQDWPEPWKVQDVQAFLSFTNFYWRFIHDYSETTLPLNHLCKKSTTWHFGAEEAKAFQNLKKAFGSALVLAHWAPDLPMMLETDMLKTGRKPREGILCSLPCLVPRVRAMSEAQPKGSSNLSSRCAMKVLMKRSGSLALATP